tara:strand:- start:48 stop:269 length:222 start_codon:yes stop_codon:yes gene_type:complete
MDRVIRKKSRWTEIEKNYLRSNAAEMKDEEIANHLRKSLKAVREMRRRLGLIKKSGRGIVELRDSNPTSESEV